MLVKSGQFVYALLADAIDRVIIPKSNQIHWEGNQKTIQINSHDPQSQISLISLESVLEYRSVIANYHNKSPNKNYGRSQNLLSPLLEPRQLMGSGGMLDDLSIGRMAIPVEPPSSELPFNPSPVILVRYQTELVGLEVDQVLSDVETLIRPLGNEFTSPSYIYGCCILGNGQSYLVIDAMTLVGESYDQDGSQGWMADAGATTHSQRAYLQQPEVLPTPSPVPALRAAEVPEDHPEDHTGNIPPSQIKSPRILVVDDSVSQRKVLKSLLERHGFAVALAKDGKDAVQQLNQYADQGDLALVICDIEMPRMNGFEFLSYCRQSSVWRSLPMVMLTSRTANKHRNVAMELGAQEYMTKPFNEKILMNVVQRLSVKDDSCLK
jgi:chemotaxis family two-component system sensor histidine kinase/response regulator PixL